MVLIEVQLTGIFTIFNTISNVIFVKFCMIRIAIEFVHFKVDCISGMLAPSNNPAIFAKEVVEHHLSYSIN